MSYGFREIMAAAKCPITCLVDGERRDFRDGNEALATMVKEDTVQGKDLTYSLTDIKAEGNRLIVSVKKHLMAYGSPDMESDWVKQFVAENGRMPDLFDGA